MKIRTQFKLFIACIIAVPLIFAAALALRQYYRSPERLLQNGYKQVRRMSERPLSKKDFSTLREMLRSLPPEVEMLIVVNHSEILLSTITEFKGRMAIDDATLFRFIRGTSAQYFYQIVSPPLGDGADVILITRIDRDKNPRKAQPHRVFRTLGIFIIVFELLCIVFVIYLSATVSRSITILEGSAERIARGELDAPLEQTKNLRTSNEITNLAGNLEKMRVALKDDGERRTRFIMGISHDLRTPVAVIKGYTEAMSDGVMTGDSQQKALEIIASKTKQLEAMISTLIDFVKLDSTDWREQLKRQPIEPEIREFVQSCVTTGGVFKRDVRADVRLSPDVAVPFDKQLFHRTLENLFSNALRYTRENDVITVSAWQDDEAIRLSVADTGIGIAPDEAEHIFDLFYRATNSRREGGMGIGLSVVKNIVDTHGWRIAVQSEKGTGTTFTITIPLEQQPAD